MKKQIVVNCLLKTAEIATPAYGGLAMTFFSVIWEITKNDHSQLIKT
jgi:hypothetical protein